MMYVDKSKKQDKHVKKRKTGEKGKKELLKQMTNEETTRHRSILKRTNGNKQAVL